jgi:hypothetical protein
MPPDVSAMVVIHTTFFVLHKKNYSDCNKVPGAQLRQGTEKRGGKERQRGGGFLHQSEGEQIPRAWPLIVTSLLNEKGEYGPVSFQ